MLVYFQKIKKTNKQTKNPVKKSEKLCDVYSDGAIAENTCRKWFARFGSGNIELHDREHFIRPVAVDDDQIESLIHKNPVHTTRTSQSYSI